MGIHFEAYCAAWNSATVSVALFARLPTSSSASPHGPERIRHLAPLVAERQVIESPLTKSALPLHRRRAAGQRPRRASSARAPPSRSTPRTARGRTAATRSGERRPARPGTSPAGGVACRSRILRLRLGVLIVGVERAPGTAAHRAARERAGARAVAELSFRVANEEPRRGSVRACAADSGSARVFSRANRRDAAPVARGRQVSSEIRRERIGRRPVSTANHSDTSVHAPSSAQRRHDGCHRVEPPRHPAIAAMQRAPPNVPRRRRRSRRVHPRPPGRRRILPPSSPRDAPGGGGASRAPRTRESRLSLALRAPARARPGGTFSARLCLEPAAPRTRAAPSRPRGPSLSVAIVIRGALSSSCGVNVIAKSRRASRASRAPIHPPSPKNETPQPRQISASLFGGAPEALVIGVVASWCSAPKRLAEIAEAAREHAPRLPAHHPASCRR